jgi:hypothetical protein
MVSDEKGDQTNVVDGGERKKKERKKASNFHILFSMARKNPAEFLWPSFNEIVFKMK